MTLQELLEDAILAEPLLEMPRLSPEDTGLPDEIWIGKVGGNHGPRIKVSNIKSVFSPSDNFVVSINKDPRVMTPRSMKIKQANVDNIIDFVKLNHDILIKMSKAYEEDRATDVLIADLASEFVKL